MEKIKLKKLHRVILWIVAAAGLTGINGTFLYSLLFTPELIREAFGNVYAMVFIIEAFLLLPVFCFLVAIARLRSPNWAGFLLLSLAGSFAFSIPFSLLLWTRKRTASRSDN